MPTFGETDRPERDHGLRLGSDGRWWWPVAEAAWASFPGRGFFPRPQRHDAGAGGLALALGAGSASPPRMRALVPLVFFAGLLQAAGAAGQTAVEPPVRLAGVVVAVPAAGREPATAVWDFAAAPLAEQTTTALAARTGNLHLAESGARSFTDILTLRGLANTPIFGDPAVTVYLDELPLGSGFTFPGLLTGLARAEVRRGPRWGTEFGRAGPAGVITLSTPSAPPNGGEVRVAGGSRNERQVAATLAARGGGGEAWLAGGYASREGSVTNRTLGRTVGDQESWSALARLRWRPTAVLELTALATGLRARDGAQPLVPLGGPFRTVERSAEGRVGLDAGNAALTAALTLPMGKLTATTSYTDWDLRPYENTLAFGPAELGSRVEQRQRGWREELRWTGAPAAVRPWRTGIFLSDTRTTGATDRNFGPFPFERSDYRIDARGAAAFGDVTWPLAPDLRLRTGARVETARRRLRRAEEVPVVRALAARVRATALLPQVGLDYAPAGAWSFFATAGAGFKPGGFSAFTANPALAPFRAERTTAFEAGVAHAPVGGAGRVAARVFWQEITDYQIERSFATGADADDFLVVNAPRARATGAEVEATWRARPGLTVEASAGVTRALLRNFTDPFTGRELSGHRAPAVPTFDASVRADYEGRGFFGGAELAVTGRTNYTEDGAAAFAQRTHALLGARAGWKRGAWAVSVFGRNLTGQRYYRAITPGVGHGAPGEPRAWGAEAVWRF